MAYQNADDIDVIPAQAAAHYPNVVTVTIERAMLTGGMVRVEGKLHTHPLIIHVGGSQRFVVTVNECVLFGCVSVAPNNGAAHIRSE